MQAIRGPLVLITLGTLFAIHQAGVLSFSRTWPLLIIVIGLVKLAERLLLQPGYTPNAPVALPPNNYRQGNYSGGTYPPPPGAPKP